MFSFFKEILDGDVSLTYEVFSFSSPVTNPRIERFTSTGEVISRNLSIYTDDFLGINPTTGRVLFFASYGDLSLSDNFRVFDGSFLIFENMSQPFEEITQSNEGQKLKEMPKAEIENRELLVRKMHYQTDISNPFSSVENSYTTAKIMNGNFGGSNIIASKLELPKELQIEEFLTPQKISQENFDDFIADPGDFENMDTVLLFNITDDLSYKLVSFTSENLIVKDVDYEAIVQWAGNLHASGTSVIKDSFNQLISASDFNGLFNYVIVRENLEVFSTDYGSGYTIPRFYYGVIPTTKRLQNPSLSNIYDGYADMKTFFPADEKLWNGGKIEDNRTQAMRISGLYTVGDYLTLSNNESWEYVLAINSF